MRFYGLLDAELLRVVELHVERAHVERELRTILGDEPEWRGRYSVVELDFSGREPQVAQLR